METADQYDSAQAAAYAKCEWVSPLITVPIARTIERWPAPPTVVDAGCGTGDQLAWIAEHFPKCRLFGFDLSEDMLAVARERCPSARIAAGSADEAFPYPDGLADLVYCSFVVMHLQHLDRFFREARRILKRPGMFLVYTNDEADIRARSLGRFFPETVEINLKRYPPIATLTEHARAAGFDVVRAHKATRNTQIDDTFIESLRGKSISDMHLITEDAHARGIERMRAAQQRGDEWVSQVTLIECQVPSEKPKPPEKKSVGQIILAAGMTQSMPPPKAKPEKASAHQEADDVFFLSKAIEQARRSVAVGQVPIGAAAVRQNELLYAAHNTVWLDCDPTAHAEINVVRHLTKKSQTIWLRGCTMYCTLEPCPMCLSAFLWTHVKRVVFGCSIDDAFALGFSELRIPASEMAQRARRPLIVDQCQSLRDECIGLFYEWRAVGLPRRKNTPGAEG